MVDPRRRGRKRDRRHGGACADRAGELHRSAHRAAPQHRWAAIALAARLSRDHHRAGRSGGSRTGPRCPSCGGRHDHGLGPPRRARSADRPGLSQHRTGRRDQRFPAVRRTAEIWGRALSLCRGRVCRAGGVGDGTCDAFRGRRSECRGKAGASLGILGWRAVVGSHRARRRHGGADEERRCRIPARSASGGARCQRCRGVLGQGADRRRKLWRRGELRSGRRERPGKGLPVRSADTRAAVDRRDQR